GSNLARRRVDAGGDVDGDDRGPAAVDALDQLGRRRPRRAVEAGAEERVDNDVEALGIGRLDRLPTGLAKEAGGDAPVAAIRASPADDPETPSTGIRAHRLPRDRRASALHQLRHGVRVAGVAGLDRPHLVGGVERLVHPAHARRGTTTATAAASSREWVMERSIAPASTWSAQAAVRPERRTDGFGRPAISISFQVKRTPQPSALPTASLPAKRAA